MEGGETRTTNRTFEESVTHNVQLTIAFNQPGRVAELCVTTLDTKSGEGGGAQVVATNIAKRSNGRKSRNKKTGDRR